MKKRPIKDVAASVRQRLQNYARANNRPFQEVLQYFAMERFLYRLAQSQSADKFILKGALMFAVWQTPTFRPTRDIDLLGRVNNSVDTVTSAIQEICGQEVEVDGLVFDVASVKGTVIKENADYQGVRVTFQATLQNARIPMQIDVGFGDVITPNATLTDYPTILDFAVPRVRGYNRETVIAEKFEAMVKLGQLNTRMKDFYDVWLLSQMFDFKGVMLSKAITRTFANRETPVELHPPALTPAFATDPTKQSQWRAFLTKTRLTNVPDAFAEITNSLSDFLLPLAAAIEEERAFEQVWTPPGPWQDLQ